MSKQQSNYTCYQVVVYNKYTGCATADVKTMTRHNWDEALNFFEEVCDEVNGNMPIPFSKTPKPLRQEGTKEAVELWIITKPAND